jgi:hypothetical protein
MELAKGFSNWHFAKGGSVKVKQGEVKVKRGE